MAAEVFPTRGCSVIKGIYSDTVLEDTRLQVSKTRKGGRIKEEIIESEGLQRDHISDT